METHLALEMEVQTVGHQAKSILLPNASQACNRCSIAWVSTSWINSESSLHPVHGVQTTTCVAACTATSAPRTVTSFASMSSGKNLEEAARYAPRKELSNPTPASRSRKRAMFHASAQNWPRSVEAGPYLTSSQSMTQTASSCGDPEGSVDVETRMLPVLIDAKNEIQMTMRR